MGCVKEAYFFSPLISLYSLLLIKISILGSWVGGKIVVYISSILFNVFGKTIIDGLKVLDSNGKGYASHLISAIEYVIENTDIQILNFSGGFSGTGKDSIGNYWLETEDAQLPARKKETDAGFDAYINEDKVIKAHSADKISLGVGFAIPMGYGIHARNRSGNFLGKNYLSPINIIT